MNTNRAELMAVVLARALDDGDVVVAGTNGTLPLAACRTAQRCGKPRVRVLIGASGTLDPSVDAAPASGGDEAFVPGRAVLGLGTGIADQLRGFADVIFLGGLQLDARGRCNLAVLGDYTRPRLRGPGSIGLSLVATVRRTFMFFERHDPRVFVECVDFVSGETVRKQEDDELIVVTPLCVFGSRAGADRVVLKSVHPCVDFDTVQSRTGFPIARDDAVETPLPTAEEIDALRACADGRKLATLRLED